MGGDGVFLRLRQVPQGGHPGHPGGQRRHAGAARHFAGHIFLVADNYTYEAAGRQVEQLLDQAGLSYHKRVFQTETPLVPNEYALGSVLAAMTSQDDMLLAVGSGTLNDVTKYVSARTGVPYVIAATAPSMDGYASTVAPTILDDFKTTLPAVYPAAIVADVDILKDAPMPMLTAGFGDIIGKFTSLADWRLSHQLNGEYYCPEVAGVIEAAVETCAANAQALAQREPQAIRAVTEALILSGLAMGMVGVSRPASGAEHQMAHYWEMDALRRGEEHPLHGNAVGVGTVLAASLYEMAAEYLPQGFAAPDKGQILACLQAAGSCADPKELGIRRELCLESLLHAMELRDRFTVQKLLEQKGKLSLCAQELVARYYGG